MQKLMIGLLSLVAATALAGTIVVQQTDEVIGYDGICQVYFRPDLGFFEVCDNAEPVILGWEFNTIHFRHGFRFREGFTRERIESMRQTNTNTNVNTNINRNSNVNRNTNVERNAMQRDVNRNLNRNTNVNRNMNRGHERVNRDGRP